MLVVAREQVQAGDRHRATASRVDRRLFRVGPAKEPLAAAPTRLLRLVSMKAGVLSTPCVRLLTPQVSIAR